MFTRPVLLDDRVLIEPTGAVAHLTGASIAEFRGRRIRAFRHYFDDSELLADARRAGPPALLRVVLTPVDGHRRCRQARRCCIRLVGGRHEGGST